MKQHSNECYRYKGCSVHFSSFLKSVRSRLFYDVVCVVLDFLAGIKRHLHKKVSTFFYKSKNIIKHELKKLLKEIRIKCLTLCVCSFYLLILFLLLSGLSHWLCLCCAQEEKGSLSGETVEATSYTSNNRKEQGTAEERRGEGRGGEAIKIFNKHCSITWQQISVETNGSEEVLPAT